MMATIQWILSLLWRVPLTLIVILLAYSILASVLEARNKDQHIVAKHAELVDLYKEHLSTNQSVGLKIQPITLNDDYVTFFTGQKNERHAYTFSLNDDPQISTRTLHSTSVPTDFGNVPLYRLAEDLSVYAIDPPAQHKQITDDSTGYGSFIFAVFAVLFFGIGILMWIWKKYKPRQKSTQKKDKTEATLSTKKPTTPVNHFSKKAWLVWATLSILLAVLTVYMGWIDAPNYQRDWTDMWVLSIIVGSNSFMLIFFIEIFLLHQRTKKGLAQKRHLLFFPSLPLIAALTVPVIFWL